MPSSPGNDSNENQSPRALLLRVPGVRSFT